jgi:hypothetical protein
VVIPFASSESRVKSIDTGKLYVKELFDKEAFYKIPEYQRPYVWGTQQIYDLLNDVSSAMDADPKKDYFLGCMIWNLVEGRLGKYTFGCRDILDGQQRFITLFLLHAVLRDRSNEKNLAAKVGERLKQKEDTYDGIPERNRVLFATRNDQPFLDKYVLPVGATQNLDSLRAVSSSDAHSNSVRTMARAILDMNSWWDSRLADIADVAEREDYLPSFFRYLSNHVMALFLATPDNLDEAYNLFTVLNSRGVQLQASDILKAQNLGEVDDEERRKKLSAEWDQRADYVKAPLSSFDELLKYVVLARVRFQSDKTRTLAAGFKTLVERGDIEPGEKFFRLVASYADNYAALTNPRNMDLSPEDQTTFENLYFILAQTVGSQFLLPLIHYRVLFADHGILGFLIRLDNLVSMSWLLGRRTLKVRLFLLIRTMDEHIGGAGSLGDRAASFLADPALRFDFRHPKSNTQMAISDFRELLENEDWGSYGGVRLNKTRYLLLKLDLLHSNPLTRLAYNRSKSSVEHILPQQPKAGLEGLDPETHSRWLHRLGNLVLLDGKKNSRLSNAAFPEKRKRYQNLFEARAYTNSVFIRHAEWGVQEIQKQHHYAIDTLIEYYKSSSPSGLRSARERLRDQNK